MLHTLIERWRKRRDNPLADRGDLVQTVLIVSGFAVIAVIAVLWIGTALTNKGADAAACVESTNTYSNGGANDCGQMSDHRYKKGLTATFACNQPYYDRYYSTKGGCAPGSGF